MAYLQPNHAIISERPLTEASCRNRCGELERAQLIKWRGNWKNAGHKKGRIRWKRRWVLERARGSLLRCASSSSSSSLRSSVEEIVESGRERKEYIVSEYGWGVRRLIEETSEMRKVAQVQAEAFYVPVFFFKELFFQFFQAEVLSGLLYKLRNSPPDRYACLVAEPTYDASESWHELVGVVDVTTMREEYVVQHLQGATEYLYISGIAVSNNFRRKKVATVLLKACENLSNLWGFEYLALRAYEDDLGARRLYANAGYRVVSGDPPWMTTWIGRKRRVLMIKRSKFV